MHTMAQKLLHQTRGWVNRISMQPATQITAHRLSSMVRCNEYQ